MARAFRAASPLPLPSSSSRAAAASGGTGGGGGGNFPWLSRKRLGAKPPSPQRRGGQEREGGGDEAAGMGTTTRAARFSATSSAEPAEVQSSSSSRKRADALARLRAAFLAEMAAYSTGALVREMSSGLVRLALECEKQPINPGEKRRALLEEPTWRAYCNGRKCGFAVRRECGADEWRVLGAVEPVSVGAGVLPDDAAAAAAAEEGDLMYMRARFERVVGSRDSEAFYMMNPDGSGGPELSIYLLRV
ncbi:Os02g0709600 [Oryza sativa Japonica Group]|uniref:Os02g0709600 protein n=2 Tax=Oryza sativa subsp. japonica TaxID=39947 RepID=Q0DY83_ORYSJ|nr:hypothetical protein EE612_013216 [Oryza sativa]BAF09805.1 Os02g0709600 [Oryza sativa Japonica Group]BAS80550.1 Os02g0709600 [Oryza sativa Japonica Group]|eukprot:NP_001047891.1 Os02g0709600 [Oryza sativa Japonica Group]